MWSVFWSTPFLGRRPIALNILISPNSLLIAVLVRTLGTRTRRNVYLLSKGICARESEMLRGGVGSTAGARLVACSRRLITRRIELRAVIKKLLLLIKHEFTRRLLGHRLISSLLTRSLLNPSSDNRML